MSFKIKMYKKRLFQCFAFAILAILMHPFKVFSQSTHPTDFAKSELENSAIPLHPGVPGKSPFWNVYAKRFIYAPAFNFKQIENAVKYRFDILSLKDSSTNTFESDVPYAPLSPVWVKVPVGNFDLKVMGISDKGEVLGVAGEGRYYRAATFNGPYLKPVMRYDKSAMLALDKIMYKDYVEYWLNYSKPDTTYQFYRYPAKIFGSLIVGAVTYAKLKSDKDTIARSIKLGRIIADYLIKISFAKGTPLEYFPPTYYGHWIGKVATSHIQLNNYMVIAAADAGNAYLDLYDFTKDEKYLDAARRIANTFVKSQLNNGSWYLFINNQTGKPTANKIAIPTAIINYFDRLRLNYKMEGLEEATKRAFNWTMENPMKTYYWQAQYEDRDMRTSKTYQNMSREQTCDMAIYLFKHRKGHPKYIKLAEDLIRFAEDQFITWEQMEDLVVYKLKTYRPAPDSIKTSPGWYSKNWLLPVVHEQYGFWMPSARNTGLMIETYWNAYAVTKKEIYLAKALSIANNFTRVQQIHHGDYPTMFTKYPMNFWINNSIYPAKVMMELENNLKAN